MRVPLRLSLFSFFLLIRNNNTNIRRFVSDPMGIIIPELIFYLHLRLGHDNQTRRLQINSMLLFLRAHRMPILFTENRFLGGDDGDGVERGIVKLAITAEQPNALGIVGEGALESVIKLDGWSHHSRA